MKIIIVTRDSDKYGYVRQVAQDLSALFVHFSSVSWVFEGFEYIICSIYESSVLHLFHIWSFWNIFWHGFTVNWTCNIANGLGISI